MPNREVFIGVTLQRSEKNQVQGSKEQGEIELELESRLPPFVLDLCFPNYMRLVHRIRVPADTWRHGLDSSWDTDLWVFISVSVER